MKVACYLNSYNEKHTGILQDFATGLRRLNIDVVESDIRLPVKADVAVIFGLVKNSYQATWPKKRIMDKHLKDGSLIVIESGFIGRPDYYAVGWNGIHGDADFRISGSMPAKRFRKLDARVWPWKHRPPFRILVCGQVPWDTNVQDIDYVKWCQTVVNDLYARGYDVRFRPHPRIEDVSMYGIGDQFIERRCKIHKSMQWADCAVAWNSTSAVDALLYGVPIITMAPNAVAKSMGITTLEPDKVIRPDRQQFFNSLGYCQWTREEMQQGTPWLHLNR